MYIDHIYKYIQLIKEVQTRSYSTYMPHDHKTEATRKLEYLETKSPRITFLLKPT